MDEKLMTVEETAKEENKSGKKNKSAKEMVEVYLQRDPNGGNNQQEFYSLNGKNYIIQRGVKVMVPVAVKALIDSNRDDADKAAEYEESLSRKSSPDDPNT